MKTRIALLFLLLAVRAEAQVTPNEDLIQISGIVVTGDSLKPVPFVNILIKDTYRGVISDYYGFFSIVARETDTLEFSSVGFRKTWFVIPDTLSEQRYSLIQILRSDTILLHEAVIYPWPTKEQFKEAFINLRIPDDDLERARKNLNRSSLNLVAETLPMDGRMNYRELMNYKSNEFYSAGQLPPYKILDPIAWAKFVDMWKSGGLKKKEKLFKEEE